MNASSATAVASAILSCTPVLIFRNRRPKNTAAPTTTGTTSSVVRVSSGCVSVSSVTPPRKYSTWRANSEIW